MPPIADPANVLGSTGLADDPATVADVDVLIVGGGPAGLATAGALGPGIRSLVVHKDAEIGLPVRTSGGTWASDMRRLEIPEHLYHPLQTLAFFSDGARVAVPLRGQGTDQCVVLDTPALYRWLGARAGTVWCGARLTAARLDNPGARADAQVIATITRADGPVEVRARRVVDASGWWSAVLSAMGLGTPPSRTGIGVEFEYSDADYDPDKGILFVGAAALGGYGWVFPVPGGRLKVGIGVLKPEIAASPKQLMTAFLASDLPAQMGLRLGRDYTVHGGTIPSVPYQRQLLFGPVVRVGDSANFATPVVGEGIRICIEQGRELGAALTAALAGDPAALPAWERACAKRFSWNYRAGFMANRRIGTYRPADWDRSVARLGRLTPSEVEAVLKSEFTLSMAARTAWRSLRRRVLG